MRYWSAGRRCRSCKKFHPQSCERSCTSITVATKKSSSDALLESVKRFRPSAIRDRPVIEAKSAVVQVIARLIRTLVQGIAELDRKIEKETAVHPDFFIFESLPGAGPAMAPRLLAAFGSQRARYRSAQEVQAYSGIAPVMERSGKKKWVHFRWAAPKYLRQSFHEWAGRSITQSQWARAYYEQQRQRGKGHHAVVRALAFKWIRIAFRCWKNGVAYDESRYLATLVRRACPLSALMVASTLAETL